ncbi:hypothetical protein J6590_048210 [Homalodisca vitripennis]|nr:hypothetical protein J6590_048210 [Homalodisca vitripennis]
MVDEVPDTVQLLQFWEGELTTALRLPTHHNALTRHVSQDLLYFLSLILLPNSAPESSQFDTGNWPSLANSTTLMPLTKLCSGTFGFAIGYPFCKQY